MKKVFWIICSFAILGVVFWRIKSLKPPSADEIQKENGGLVIASVGDIACQSDWEVTKKQCQQQAVADLVTHDPEINLLLILGDIQYGRSKSCVCCHKRER